MYTEPTFEERKDEVQSLVEEKIRIMGGDGSTIAACKAVAEYRLKEGDSGTTALENALSIGATIIDAQQATACCL